MGMACDVEGCAVPEKHEVSLIKTSSIFDVQANETKMETDTSGLDPEETAMILTCLSKGYSEANAVAGDFDSDPEDMRNLSDHDEDTLQRRQLAGVGKVHRVQQINFDGPKGSKLDFTDDAGFSHCFRNESNRVKSLVTKHISIDELRAHFDRPIIDVAKDFGICITLMKKICRRNGIKRWPHRQIRSLSKSIASMEAAMLSAHESERDEYYDQIMSLKMKRKSVIADPNKDNSMRHTISPLLSTVTDVSNQSTRASHPVHATLRLSPWPVHDESYVSSSNGTPVMPIQKIESLVVSTPSTSTTNPSKGGRWTSEEHSSFLEGVRLYGKDWRRVAQVVKTRSAVQTRTHAQKYLLKFAGRSFPFEADGVTKETLLSPLKKPVLSVSSPVTSVASSTAISPPASDESRTNDLWKSIDIHAITKHGEAMATILNGRSPMKVVSERFGNNGMLTTVVQSPLPSLTKVEQSAALAQELEEVLGSSSSSSFSYYSSRNKCF